MKPTAPLSFQKAERQGRAHSGAGLERKVAPTPDWFTCYPDYCGASSSRRSAAWCSTERKCASRGVGSGTVGTRCLRCYPRCDSPCDPCRSSACCCRFAYPLVYFPGCGHLVNRQPPLSQQVRQEQQSA